MILAAGALLALVLLAAAPGAAAARSFSIERFAVALDVQPDAAVAVQESLTVVFTGEHRGILRRIPLRHTRAGLNARLRLDRIHVLDEAFQPLRTEVAHGDGALTIRAWVPGARDTVRTVHVLYRAQRALLTTGERDELYWNVTGTEWEVPIGAAEATVRLPAGAAAVETTAFTGPRGAAGRDWTEHRQGRAVTFRTTRPLGPREGLTIAVAWPAGLVRRPSALQEAWWGLADNWPLALPVAAAAVMGLLWGVYGRDPAARRSIKPEYAPPPALTVAQAGTLIDEHPEPRDVFATLVDLAVRGYLDVERLPGERDFRFRRRRPLAGDPALRPAELVVLRKVFGEGLSLAERRLGELRENHEYVFEPIRDALDEGMVRDGFFAASPFWVRQRWGAAGVLLLLAAGALGAADAPPLAHLGWTLPAGLAASGLVVLAFARAMPRRTLRGARLLVTLRGFQEFLARAEKDRLERLPPDTLHRWLPWAIALGVTDRWIHRWEGLPVAPPTWYVGPGPFDLEHYRQDVERLRREHDAAMVRARGDRFGGRSAFGRGGGASGGGAGGGGGGTF